MDDDLPFEEWLRRELNKQFMEEIEKSPWWCLVCGVGGNYEGDRPDEYLPPPLWHECDLSNEVEKRGIIPDA